MKIKSKLLVIRTAFIVGLFAPICGASSAATLSQFSMNAGLSVTAPQGSGLTLLPLIDDDGTNPLTTYQIVTPTASLAGSSASNGTVDSSAADSGQLGLSISGQTTTVNAGPFVSALAAASASAGFVLLNDGLDDIEVAVQILGSWLISAAADSAFFDFASASLAANYLENGEIVERLVDRFEQTPPGSAIADSVIFIRNLIIPAQSQYIISLNMAGQALGVSVGETRAVPEPGTLALICAGFLVLRSRRISSGHAVRRTK